MKFEIYCDESSIEAVYTKAAQAFAAIGGIWMPADFRDQFKEDVKAINESFKIRGEFKWNKVSPSYFDYYLSLLDYFFQNDNLRYRCILLESEKIDNYKFHRGDSELGFYKFYYQLLHHWILDFNDYNIFIDLKVNRDRHRLKTLCDVLNNANLTSVITQVQGLPSEQSLGIQLADFLTGLSTAKFNNQTTSEAKLKLIERVESEYLKTAISPTPRSESKFNIFKINLKGGW